MRKIVLRINELKKYKIIKELVDHNGNKNRAAIKIGISRRQIDRLIIKLRRKANLDLFTETVANVPPRH